MLRDAVLIAINENIASPSYLQRKLRIGYMRARRVLDITVMRDEDLKQ